MLRFLGGRKHLDLGDLHGIGLGVGVFGSPGVIAGVSHGGMLPSGLMERAEERTDPGWDVIEGIRVALILVGLAINVYLMWDYVKDRPEVEVTRKRVQGWWERAVAAPLNAESKLRRMENQAVYEAIQVVEEVPNAGS